MLFCCRLTKTEVGKQRSARWGYRLLNVPTIWKPHRSAGQGDFSIHLHIVVAYESITSVVELVGTVAFAVGWDGSVERHFRQEVGAVGAVAPIAGAQLVEGYGGVDALGTRRQDCLIESDDARLDG